MICTMKELLADADKHGRAVGGFNVANMESVMGAIRAAEEMDTPIILQIAEKRMGYSPVEYIAPMMVEAARTAGVRVAVHLDHGKSREMIKRTLEYGFTSVMFDGSDETLEENIRLTRQIAEMAKPYGATVEAELGVVGGNEGSGDHQVLYTDVKEAERFAREAGMDALAIAIGNAHGHYKGVPNLNFDVLRNIAGRVSVPLVLHGGTGITDEQFREAICCGIRKINIATANFDALTKGAADYLAESKEHNYFELNEQMVQRLEAAREMGLGLRYVARFDANGKARVGVEAVREDHPLASLLPCDNVFAIESRWYRDNPLVIRGPGAGRDVTAGAIQSDINRLAQLL